MNQKASDSISHKQQILFLFPLVYRPQKINFSGKFKHLSQWYNGHIFSLSGGKQRYLTVSEFFFHSEKEGNSAIGRLFRGLWAQLVVPLILLRGNFQANLIIAYDPYRSGLAALFLKYLFRCKMIVEVNGDYYKIQPGQTCLSKVIMKFLFNLNLRYADAVKVLNTEQEVFCRRLLPRKPIYRFPNFVATEYFQSLDTYQGNYLLSVGYPFYLKGVDTLIKAFILITEKHPNINLRIMGFCPKGEIEKYLAIACDHPRIMFIKPGWIDDVAEQMRGCFAIVNAARSEAMGRVHVEAMACGKPILATRTNGGMECIVDGETGLLCAIDDIEDLAAKLDELLSDPHRADCMGQAGKLRMKVLFSEEAYAQSFHTMVEEVLQKAVVV